MAHVRYEITTDAGTDRVTVKAGLNPVPWYSLYDEAGDLNYGVSGAGTFIKECLQIKRLE